MIPICTQGLQMDKNRLSGIFSGSGGEAETVMDDSECVKWDFSQFPWISSMPPVRVVPQHTYNIHCTICKRRAHIKRGIFKDLSLPHVPPTTLHPVLCCLLREEVWGILLARWTTPGRDVGDQGEIWARHFTSCGRVSLKSAREPASQRLLNMGKQSCPGAARRREKWGWDMKTWHALLFGSAGTMLSH